MRANSVPVTDASNPKARRRMRGDKLVLSLAFEHKTSEKMVRTSVRKFKATDGERSTERLAEWSKSELAVGEALRQSKLAAGEWSCANRIAVNKTVD